MINEKNVKSYCKEDISLIENKEYKFYKIHNNFSWEE